MIRHATLADADWLLDLGCECYRWIDRPASAAFVDRLLRNPDAIALRGEHSMAFGLLYRRPENPAEISCDLLFVASRQRRFWDREVDDILTALDSESRARGATKLWIVSTTVDLSPVARRIGARRVGSVHVMEAT